MKKVDKKDKVIMLLTIIILILVVLLVLLIGMKSLSKTTTTKDNNTKKEDKVEIKEETLTSEEKNSIIDKIKECQNELARLHDLKILNDKRESTGQIKKIDIMIDDLTLEETIKNYEDEISFLIKHSNLK